MNGPKRNRKDGSFRTLSLALLIGFGPCLLAQDRAPLFEHRLAQEELQLAKTPSLYFIISLKSRTIALKSRGITLREWGIDGLHAWGDPPSPEPVTLRKKSTLFPPRRNKIKPAANEDAESTFELDALELKDMPSRFTLFLSGDLRIYVRAKAGGFLPRLGNVGHFFAWHVWAPLTNLVFELRKRPFAALEIVLPRKEDSQTLYWAFPEELKGLIYPL